MAYIEEKLLRVIILQELKRFFVIIISTGKQMLDKIQPDSSGLSYGTLPDGSDSIKSPSGEKKGVWDAERDGCGPVIQYHFLKYCTCSIYVSSYFMLTCACLPFSPWPPPPCPRTIRAFLSFDSLRSLWNVIWSVPHTLDLSPWWSSNWLDLN